MVRTSSADVNEADVNEADIALHALGHETSGADINETHIALHAHAFMLSACVPCVIFVFCDEVHSAVVGLALHMRKTCVC